MGMPTLSPPPITTSFLEKEGKPVLTWARWFQLLQQIITGALHPTTPAGLAQSGVVYQGEGVPSGSNGNDGDVYFRTDTPGTLNQRIYVRVSGSWTGIL